MPVNNTLTPTIIEMNVLEVTEVTKKINEYNLYVNAMEYKELPLDANVREPDVKKSKPYKEMMDTLNRNPQNFYDNNLGISAIAKKVSINKNRVKIEFPHGMGVLNGGHTQKAILDSQVNDISEAIVKIIIRERDYNLERIAEIAYCQNSSSQVKPYSLAEKKGLFGKLKNSLNSEFEKHIIWFEGRVVPNDKGVDPTDVIAMLNLFNIKKNASEYSETQTQPTQSSSSKGVIFKNWTQDSNSYELIYNLVNDIIRLKDHIVVNYSKSTKITKLKIISDMENKSNKILPFTNQKYDYGIPNNFLMPMLAAFRANVYYNEVKKEIGWFVKNEELFDIIKKDLCKRISNTYTTTYHSNINNASKDPNLWELLYVDVLKNIDRSKDPEIIYEV